jgi:hypothetical protein
VVSGIHEVGVGLLHMPAGPFFVSVFWNVTRTRTERDKMF